MSAQFDCLGNGTKDITGCLMVSPMSKTGRVLILDTSRHFSTLQVWEQGQRDK